MGVSFLAREREKLEVIGLRKILGDRGLEREIEGERLGDIGLEREILRVREL